MARPHAGAQIGEHISYLRTTASRSTGLEVNPGRALVNLTYDDNDLTHTLTIADGDLAVADLGRDQSRIGHRTDVDTACECGSLTDRIVSHGHGGIVRVGHPRVLASGG